MAEEVELCVEIPPNMEDVWEEALDVDRLCRACANTNESMIPIFEGDGIEHELQAKIAKHLPVKITKEDGLPHQMCFQCASTLVAWHDMFTNCIEAEKKLTNLVNKAKDAKDDEQELQEMEEMEEQVIEEEVIETSIAEDMAIEKFTTDVQERTVREMEMDDDNREDDVEAAREDDVEGIDENSGKKEDRAGTTIRDQLTVMNKEQRQISRSAPKRSYHCRKCNCPLKSQYAYRKHLKAHKMLEEEKDAKENDEDRSIGIILRTETTEIQIPKCGLTPELEEKIVPDLEMKCFQCEQCGKSFELRESLRSHEQSHVLALIGVYPKENVFVVKIEENEEVVEINGDVEVNAEYVEVKVEDVELNEEDLDIKVKDIEVDVKDVEAECYECVPCAKSFSSKESLISHELGHSWALRAYPKENIEMNLETNVKDLESERFQCEQCGKSFVLKESLRSHRRAHAQALLRAYRKKNGKVNAKVQVNTENLQVKCYLCEQCGKSFALRESLRSHKRSHARALQGDYPKSDKEKKACKLCEKLFSIDGLRYHMKFVHHLDSKKHKCDFCGKLFASNFVLNIHRRVHTGEKPFVCEICGVRKTSKTTLQHHMGKHRETPPFVCEICNAGFTAKQLLSRHTMKHSDVKNFVCDTCGKAFRSYHQLYRHKLIHSDTKTDSCPLCSAKFSQIRYVRRHIKEVHKLKPADVLSNQNISSQQS